MNGYFDTDMAIKLASELHTFFPQRTYKIRVSIIDIVCKSREMRLFRNQKWIRKQYLNSKYGLWCCVRHGKSKRLKESLSSK